MGVGLMLAGLAGAGIAGNMAGTAQQAYYNAKEAKKQREFQKEMSNTAHRREVRDLELAGLNPILSATGGPGASSPAGASGSVSGSNPASDALSAALMGAQIRKLHSETKLTKEKGNTQSFTNRLLGRLTGYGASAVDFAEEMFGGLVGKGADSARKNKKLIEDGKLRMPPEKRPYTNTVPPRVHVIKAAGSSAKYKIRRK